MALVQTHRFNWMGYEGTESQALNIALLRHGDAGSLRYSDYRQRQQVVAEIKMRLKLIKRDLGLLPPEEMAEIKNNNNNNKEDEDELNHMYDDDNNNNDIALDSARRSESMESEGDIATKMAERRRQLLSKGPLGDSDDDEDDEDKDMVYLWPQPPSTAETQKALPSVSTEIKSLLLEMRASYVSYLDGAEFLTLAELQEYNNGRRAVVAAALDKANENNHNNTINNYKNKSPRVVSLPEESEFDTTPLAAALEERTQLRMKLDSLRAASDVNYAAHYIRSEELDNSGRPITNITETDGDEATLSAKLTEAKKKLEEVRAAYNKRAAAVARRVQRVIANSVTEAEL